MKNLKIMSTLKLVLKYKWFDMIESGKKKEEYREIKESIVSLLFNWNMCGHTRESFTKELLLNGKETVVSCRTILWMYQKDFDKVEFYRGYSKGRKTMTFNLKKITIGSANPELSDNWQGDVFIIKLGKQIKPQTAG